jgi:hypothetical protein
LNMKRAAGVCPPVRGIRYAAGGGGGGRGGLGGGGFGGLAGSMEHLNSTHSVISSARASSVGGTVRPSAFAGA